MSSTTQKLSLFRTLSRLAGLFVPLFFMLLLSAPRQVYAATCRGVDGLDTAIGCIPTATTNDFAAWFLGWAVGIGGGIAFLLILMGGFRIMTSGGNPDQIKAGKEQLTSAITGLFFIIFSVFLLQLIGVQILHIPGF